MKLILFASIFATLLVLCACADELRCMRGCATCKFCVFENVVVKAGENPRFSAQPDEKFIGFRRSEVAEIPQSLFEAHPKAEYLHLQDVNLAKVENGTFAKAGSLKFLDLASNRDLVMLDDGAFFGLENLLSLDLSGSPVAKLSQMALYGLFKLVVLDLRSLELIELKTKSFQGLQQVKRLNLAYNYLTVLKADSFFDLLSLEELDLSSNQLTQLENGWSSERHLSNLVNLTLTNNQLETLSRNDLAFMRSLRKLMLDGNLLKQLNESFLEPLNALKDLDLSRNKIEQVDNGAFCGLVSLEALSLGYNQVKTFHFGDKCKNERIKSILLQSNPMEYLGPNSFEFGGKSLETLDISGGELTNVDPQAFNGLESLQELHLHGNKLETLAFDANLKLPSLKKLLVNYNELRSIQLPSDSNSLEILELQYNKFEEIKFVKDVSLDNFMALNMRGNQLKMLPKFETPSSNFKTLRLDQNQLTEIQDGAFVNQPALECLILEQNEIKTIGSKAFLGLSKLTRLDLGKNQLETLDFDPEIKLDSLKLLILKENRLKSLTLPTKSSLKFLSLEKNQLMTLPSFESVKASLTNLYISENQLEEIKSSSFGGLNSVKSLFLDGNRINKWTNNEKGLTNLDILDLSNNSLANLDPEAFSALANLKQLDLDDNQLSILDGAAFKGLSSLLRLRLNKNQLETLNFETDIPKLKSLEAKFNRIQEINVKALAKKIPNLKRLNVDLNPLTEEDIRLQREANKEICVEFVVQSIP